MPLRGDGASSIGMQGVPRSSQAVRWPTTLKCFLSQASGLLAERQGGCDAVPFEQFGPLPADAPHVAYGKLDKGLLLR